MENQGKKNEARIGWSALSAGLGFCPKKITVLAILGAFGFVPFLLGDIFRTFVFEHMGIAMCLPFLYGGAIVLFWAVVDGNLNKEHS